MAPKDMTMVDKTASFVVEQLAIHRAEWKQETPCPPLVVGVQGPQGAGKSHLTGLLPDHLSSNYGLRLAILSLDDYYLTQRELVILSGNNASNSLLQGRGPAGTHDMALLYRSLRDLKRINSDISATVRLPTYDKSAFGGLGNRSSKTVQVQGPIDVVIFEGWMCGFASLPDQQMDEVYDEFSKRANQGLGLVTPSIPRASLHQINQNLRRYEDTIWGQIDCFVQIQPVELKYVWTWRLQQEHHMKSQNGHVGMADEEVEAFINRFMPSYELFENGINSPGAPWNGRGLRYIVNLKREIVKCETF